MSDSGRGRWYRRRSSPAAARLDRPLHFFERERPLPGSPQRAAQAFYVVAGHGGNQLKAFTGARLDEIPRANIADLYELGGVDIRLDNRGEDGPRKTEASERKVFLHPALIAEGFLGYVHSLPKDGPMDRCFLALRLFAAAWRRRTNPSAEAPT
jgi:hypothetical protein